MKQFLTAVGLSVVFLFLPGFSEGVAEVRFVYDGDTVLLESGQRLRYLGIDAPEMDHGSGENEFMAEEAREFNAALVMGNPIRLEFDQESQDRYGRLLAYVYLECGRMVNIELLDRGLAWVLAVPPNLRHLERMIDSQRDAMTRRVGIWQKEAEADDGPYIGNRRSFRFHRLDCPFQQDISSRNRIGFQTKREAFWEGYSPCGRCRP